MRPGDYLLCYMTGISRWIGILEVTSQPYKDDTPIWKHHDAFERAFGRFLKDLQAVETPPMPQPAEPLKASEPSKVMPQNPQTVITRKKRRLEVLEE